MQRTLDALSADERTLDLAVALALAERPKHDRVLLVVDQLEECFKRSVGTRTSARRSWRT